jgi:hypothetical protein
VRRLAYNYEIYPDIHRYKQRTFSYKSNRGLATPAASMSSFVYPGY